MRKRAALKRLHQAVEELNNKAPGVEFTITPHNAVDRWTGGAADGLLFVTLEPHATDPAAWRPIVLEIDTGGLGEEFRSGLALLLFLLRDLCDGLIPFGHGTTRGMGAVRVDPAAVTFEAGTAVPLRDEVHGRSLSELLSDKKLTALLDQAWATAGDVPAEDTADGAEEGEQADEASATTEPAGKPTPRPALAATRAGDSPTVSAPSPAPAAVPRRCTSTAQDALRAFAATRFDDLPMVGFAYSSVAAPWFRLTAEGTPQDSSGAPLDLTGVFELRAFDRHRELRWWHTGNGLGETRELTDDSMGLGGARPSRSYGRLLWGKVTAAERGWATLSEPRIGTVRIPVSGPVPAGGHAWLNAVEYVAEDEHGNVAVIDERLTGVEVKGPAQ
jgi:CRISPR-associated protein (TIGR03984 family)